MESKPEGRWSHFPDSAGEKYSRNTHHNKIFIRHRPHVIVKIHSIKTFCNHASTILRAGNRTPIQSALLPPFLPSFGDGLIPYPTSSPTVLFPVHIRLFERQCYGNNFFSQLYPAAGCDIASSSRAVAFLNQAGCLTIINASPSSKIPHPHVSGFLSCSTPHKPGYGQNVVGLT